MTHMMTGNYDGEMTMIRTNVGQRIKKNQLVGLTQVSKASVTKLENINTDQTRLGTLAAD